MKKTKLLLVGATGRMGAELVRLAQEKGDFELSVAISRSRVCQEFKKTAKDISTVSAQDVDIIIDFSSAEQFSKTVNFAKKNKIPLVSGVTGITSAEIKMLKQASAKSAILWAPNMSIGIAVLRNAIKAFEQIKDFDFQIVEAHHSKKKDAPSGTAILLQETLEKAVRQKLPAPLSVRGGGIIGEHDVMAMSEEEVITFSHSAIHRAVFAKGALRAARWLMSRSNGLFCMEDVVIEG
jgi:4-hydroxy-tetrahydrodipicolinate reductase